MVEYTPPSGGGGGLTSVATDASLTGDGTVLDPLSVVRTDVYSVATAYFSKPLPFTSPFTAFPMTGGGYIDDIVSADFDTVSGAIRPSFDGVMKITVQFTFASLPAGSHSTVLLTAGLSEVFFPTPIASMQESETLYIANGTTALQTISFVGVVNCVSGTQYNPYIEASGDVIDFELLGDEGRTTIIMERLS
jgi:hypothetical protein